MQIAVSASILALAASASASTVYGSLYQYYHANATCDPDIVPTYPEGKALAIGSLDSCAEVVPGVDGAEFKLFKGVPLVPTFSFKLYSDLACNTLVTDDNLDCVSGVKSYKLVRL